MTSKLSNICFYAKGKVAVKSLTKANYISTENMLPNRGGVVNATTLPTIEDTQGYCVGDVLVSNIRPYFKKIWFADSNGGCSNDVLVFRAKEGVDARYLYYVLADDSFFNYSNATSKGTKMPRGDKSAIMDYIIEEHSLIEQHRIADILSALDKKIANNNAINDNLQQQALMLFSELISSPLGTKNGVIGDYCSVKSGFAFKSTWWTDTGVRVIKIKTIDNDALNLDDCSFVSIDKASYARDFIVGGGDLLIAMTGATIGKFAIVPKVAEPLLVNQRVGKFFLGKDPLGRLPFIFCTLKQPDIISEIINRGQGSAQPNISGSDIMSVGCYLPDKDVVDKFNSLCRPFFESIIENQHQNHLLSTLRDALLPKLMSGEIDVSDVKI